MGDAAGELSDRFHLLRLRELAFQVLAFAHVAHQHDQMADDTAPIAHRRHDDVRSEEHTSELQSLMRISYAVFCLKKKKNTQKKTTYIQPTKKQPTTELKRHT